MWKADVWKRGEVSVATGLGGEAHVDENTLTTLVTETGDGGDGVLRQVVILKVAMRAVATMLP